VRSVLDPSCARCNDRLNHAAFPMDDKSVGVALTYLESVRYMCGKDSKAR
jgi:hypothetical protein